MIISESNPYANSFILCNFRDTPTVHRERTYSFWECLGDIGKGRLLVEQAQWLEQYPYPFAGLTRTNALPAPRFAGHQLMFAKHIRGDLRIILVPELELFGLLKLRFIERG